MGEGPPRGAGLRQGGESLLGQESPVPEKQEIKKFTTGSSWMERHFSRETGQNHRRGSGASRFPESLTEEVHPMGEHATDGRTILVKGWSMHPEGPWEKLW